MILNLTTDQNYLISIAELIEAKFTQNINELKIILPTVGACIRLQEILIQRAKNGACILPQIVPIVNIGIGSEGIYQIPSNNVEPLSYLEQRVIIAGLIRIEDSNLTVTQSLELSSHIIRLFSEFASFGINIENLAKAAPHDVAEHWQHMSEFLQKIYAAWQEFKAKNEKIDLSEYRQNMSYLEIKAAKEKTYPQIMAGIFPEGDLMEELVDAISESEVSYLLPPQENSAKLVASYDYEKAENLRGEAELIAQKVLQWTKNNPEIAIVTKNSDLIHMCTHLLEAHNIESQNMNGYSLKLTKPYEFFMLLIGVIDRKDIIDLEKFLTLLKTHYLFSEEARKYELELRRGKTTESALFNDIKLDAGESILKSYIALAEKLAPNLWKSFEGQIFSEFLYELLCLEPHNFTEQEYMEFIKTISEGARYYKEDVPSRVKFMSAEEASIGGYEHIIFADMNDGSFPSKMPNDPWMNATMRETLGLPGLSDNMAKEWYYFNNLLHRKNIYMTRALVRNGVETVASRFLQQLIAENNYASC